MFLRLAGKMGVAPTYISQTTSWFHYFTFMPVNFGQPWNCTTVFVNESTMTNPELPCAARKLVAFAGVEPAPPNLSAGRSSV